MVDLTLTRTSIVTVEAHTVGKSRYTSCFAFTEYEHDLATHKDVYHAMCHDEPVVVTVELELLPLTVKDATEGHPDFGEMFVHKWTVDSSEDAHKNFLWDELTGDGPMLYPNKSKPRVSVGAYPSHCCGRELKKSPVPRLLSVNPV